VILLFAVAVLSVLVYFGCFYKLRSP